MSHRNPTPRRGRSRKPRKEAPPGTPGEMLFRLARDAQPGTADAIKLIESAARALAAEARAGLWLGD